VFGLGARRRRPPAAIDAADDLVFDRHLERRLEALAIATRKQISGGQRAERASRNIGVGIEFAEHRAYAQGEDIRFVDWAVYERSRRFVVRRFTELADLTVHLLLDTSASMSVGARSKLAYGRRMTAALAYIALARLDRVGIVSVSGDEVDRFRPTRGRHRMLRVVSFLRALESSGETNLALGASAIARAAGRRGVAVILSDLYDPRGIEPAIDRLRYAGVETHVVHLLDPEELDDRRLDDVRLVDAERDLSVELTLSPAILAAARERAARRVDAIARACVDRGVTHHRIDIRKPFEDGVLRVLRRGGLVG